MLYEYTVPSTHHVVDQCIGDGRSFEVAIILNGRTDCPDSEMVDATIASVLRKTHLKYLLRRVGVEEQRAQKYNMFLRGRQIPDTLFGQFQ